VSGFGRILEDLNADEVDYVLVGGIALIRHGVVRATIVTSMPSSSPPSKTSLASAG
jgi:hypothetical protein